MDVDSNELSKSNSESFTDLPMALKECIDALEDFDLLSPSPMTVPFPRLETSSQSNLPPIQSKTLAIYVRKRTNDLEQITEEESFQPDASDIVDMRSNDFHARLSQSECLNYGNFIASIDPVVGISQKTPGMIQQDEYRPLCVSSQVSAKCLHSVNEPIELLSPEKRSNPEIKFESKDFKNLIQGPITTGHQLSSVNEISLISKLDAAVVDIERPSSSTYAIKELNGIDNQPKLKFLPHELSKPQVNFSFLFKKKKKTPIVQPKSQTNSRPVPKPEPNSLHIIKTNQFRGTTKFQSPKVKKLVPLTTGSENIDPRSAVFVAAKDQSRPSSTTCLPPRDLPDPHLKFFQKTYFSNQVQMSKSSLQSTQAPEKSRRQAHSKESICFSNPFNPETKSIFEQTVVNRNSEPSSKDKIKNFCKLHPLASSHNNNLSLKTHL